MPWSKRWLETRNAPEGHFVGGRPCGRSVSRAGARSHSLSRPNHSMGFGNSPVRPIQAYPVQSHSMFAARPFSLNLAVTTQVAAGARAISTKTTTIKG